MLHRHPLRRAFALAVLAPALLASCLAMRSPAVGEPISLGPKEALVIGRVRVFEQERELHPWKLEQTELLLADPELKLSLLHVESGRKRAYVQVDSDSTFEWIVPAGTYLIYHTPSVEPPVNEPLAAFQVAAGPDPVDLGALRLELTVQRPAIGEAAGYEVVDVAAEPRDAEAALSQLAQRLGTFQIRRGTLIVDPELRGLFSDGSRAACARVLAKHGVELGAR